MFVSVPNVLAGVAVELCLDLVERVLHPGDPAVVGAAVGVGEVVELLGEPLDALAQVAVGVPTRVDQQLPGSAESIACHARSPRHANKTVVPRERDDLIISDA